MNRSRYLTRRIDTTDHAIIAALTEDGRLKFRELADLIGMSSPSVTERVRKLEDAGAIRGYTTIVDLSVFGLAVTAQLRIRAMPGEMQRVAKLLEATSEVIEADQVSGQDCFMARVVVNDTQDLQAVVERFQPYSAVDTSVILSSTVVRRLPKL